MHHTPDGLLRRLLDEPAGVPDPERAHVAGCERCLDRLAAVRADADRAGAALRVPTDHGQDDGAAWDRLAAAAAAQAGAGAAPEPGRAPRRAPLRGAPRRAPLRGALRRPAVAAAAFALALAGAGTAAANDWLQVFRTEQVVPVALGTEDLVELPDLTAYGEVRSTSQPQVHRVASAAAAAEETGLDVPEATVLPPGVGGQPEWQAGGEASATFTFSADRAARAAAATGADLPPVPPGLDGTSVRLDAGPGVAAVWSQPSGVPSLLVGRAVAPTAYSDGVPFEQVRDYLLGLPGLPADLAAQLRGFTADGTTLPLPVPADAVTTTTAEVAGAPATVLETRDRALAAVVWVQDGVLTAVAGALDADEVLAVARGLR
ncbi:hypothetical protein [Vallicoccus soli]|uniref:DUF4367 domain-containing protein n=1 Tax=Vallicoccus soli TaxID=2339232 RepID=A0A3A3YY13_9ACTN|nr:hypothetical protein [Vallicoccus soli]RJK94853.1 hypothetical protein D5H78_13675 [Vallicoccus soli]